MSIAVRQVEFMVNAKQVSVPLFLRVVVVLVDLAMLATVVMVVTLGRKVVTAAMVEMAAMEAWVISSLHPWRRHWLMWEQLPFPVAEDLEVSPMVPMAAMEELAGLEAVVKPVAMEAGKAMKALLVKEDLQVPMAIRIKVGVELALAEQFLSRKDLCPYIIVNFV